MSSDGYEEAAALLAGLKREGLTLCGAESCTGGLVSAALTAAPGASEAFAGAVVSYADGAKRRLLGVGESVLAGPGPVSEACALAMADGALEAFGADLAFAVTGLAGPGGGSDELPVGSVFIAYGRAGDLRLASYSFEGEREAVRRAACLAAIGLLRDYLAAR